MNVLGNNSGMAGMNNTGTQPAPALIALLRNKDFPYLATPIFFCTPSGVFKHAVSLNLNDNFKRQVQLHLFIEEQMELREVKGHMQGHGAGEWMGHFPLPVF